MVPLKQKTIIDYQKFNLKLKKQIYKQYNGKCQYCKKPTIRNLSHLHWLQEFMLSEDEAKKNRENNISKLNSYKSNIHHLIPKYQKGGNDPKNLVLLCKKCHVYIHSWNYFFKLIEIEREVAP